MASEKHCGRRGSGRWASRCRWRRSRTMVFGLDAADENDVLRRRDGLACQQRRTSDFRRRWRHRRRQHQAPDAAIIDAMLGVGIAGGGRLVAGDKRMADDAARSRCRFCRGACRAKARDQARQRNRIGRRQRNNAPPQRPCGEILAHDPNLVPANSGTAATLARRYRDYHYMNPDRRDLFRNPVATAQRWRQRRQRGPSLWRASTARTASTNCASGTARCASACFCRYSSRPFSSLASSAPTIRVV
jgi:hypothetical protein